MKLAVAVDERGRPLSVATAAANVAEVNLAGPVLDRLPSEVPEGTPVVADRGYDSDRLREETSSRGLVLVAPHRRGRIKPPTTDGRRLRRHRVGHAPSGEHGKGAQHCDCGPAILVLHDGKVAHASMAVNARQGSSWERVPEARALDGASGQLVVCL